MPLGLQFLKARLSLVSIICILLISSCGKAIPLSTVVPTATPASPQERVNAYLRELTITLSRLQRDISRIEASRSDSSLVALAGTSVFLDYQILEKMQVPSIVDTRQVGILEDYTEAHKWLLGVLHDCDVLGKHAQFDEQNEAMVKNILDSEEVCKIEVQFLKNKYPEFFICPPDETTCR